MNEKLKEALELQLWHRQYLTANAENKDLRAKLAEVERVVEQQRHLVEAVKLARRMHDMPVQRYVDDPRLFYFDYIDANVFLAVDALTAEPEAREEPPRVRNTADFRGFPVAEPAAEHETPGEETVTCQHCGKTREQHGQDADTMSSMIADACNVQYPIFRAGLTRAALESELTFERLAHAETRRTLTDEAARLAARVAELEKREAPEDALILDCMCIGLVALAEGGAK